MKFRDGTISIVCNASQVMEVDHTLHLTYSRIPAKIYTNIIYSYNFVGQRKYTFDRSITAVRVWSVQYYRHWRRQYVNWTMGMGVSSAANAVVQVARSISIPLADSPNLPSQIFGIAVALKNKLTWIIPPPVFVFNVYIYPSYLP